MIHPQAQVAGAFSEQWQKVIETKSLDEIFNNPKVSEFTKQELSVELEKLYQKVLNELDSTILRGKDLGQFAYDIILEKFENDLESIVQNDRGRELLKSTFETQIESIRSEEADNVLQSCLRGAILTLIIEFSGVKNLQKSESVPPTLLTYLEGNTIIRELVKSGKIVEAFILESYAQLFNPSNKDGINTYESNVYKHIDSISRAEISQNYLATFLGSIYNQYQGEILELSVVDNKLNIFTLDGNKRVIVIDPVSNFNDEISIQEVVREATSGLHQCFKSNLDAQEQHNIVYEDEINIIFFTQRQTVKGFDTVEGFFKEVLYYWKLVSISQFITDDFQGTLSKQDYLITTKTITIEQLKNLGITKIFDAHGRELSLSGELKGSYRILTSEDGENQALIEVTGENVRTPNGWVDGICIAGTWIRNALLTNKEGNLLSSSFFNPYNPTSFELKNDNWLEIEFL